MGVGRRKSARDCQKTKSKESNWEAKTTLIAGREKCSGDLGVRGPRSAKVGTTWEKKTRRKPGGGHQR